MIQRKEADRTLPLAPIEICRLERKGEEGWEKRAFVHHRPIKPSFSFYNEERNNIACCGEGMEMGMGVGAAVSDAFIALLGCRVGRKVEKPGKRRT